MTQESNVSKMLKTGVIVELWYGGGKFRCKGGVADDAEISIIDTSGDSVKEALESLADFWMNRLKDLFEKKLATADAIARKQNEKIKKKEAERLNRLEQEEKSRRRRGY